ncbi:MAG: ABC transporter ATP-binding protein [Planctomycetota bacterium]
MIRLSAISKTFDRGASYVVRDLDLEIADGETLVLLGSSGCGKTTTLKMINRLVEPSAGAITIGDRNVLDMNPVELRRSIGYVFQNIGLFPHMTVAQNIAVVPQLLGWPKDRRRQRVAELLELVELPPGQYAGRYPQELSGGQRQRVGVCRALAADPAYLLMDEPFGALDALTRDSLQQEMLAIKARLHKTIVFVTHDIFEALALGDRIAVMNAGGIEQLGDRNELLTHPKTAFVRNLFAKPAEQLKAFTAYQAAAT